MPERLADPETLAQEHWDWLGPLLGKIYKDSFEHGFKHALESRDLPLTSCENCRYYFGGPLDDADYKGPKWCLFRGPVDQMKATGKCEVGVRKDVGA